MTYLRESNSPRALLTEFSEYWPSRRNSPDITLKTTLGVFGMTKSDRNKGHADFVGFLSKRESHKLMNTIEIYYV